MQRLPLLTNVNNEEMLKMVLTQLSEIDLEVVNKIKEIKGCKSRCILDDEPLIDGKCVCCGKEAKHHVIWGIQY